MKKIHFLMLVITFIILIVGFIQIKEVYALPPCDGFCEDHPTAARCYCPGTSRLVSCPAYLAGVCEI